jgi:hypothetical protein
LCKFSFNLLETDPTPEPLIMLNYYEEVSDGTRCNQKEIVIALASSEQDLSCIDFALQMIIETYVLDEEIGETDKDKAKILFKSGMLKEKEELPKSYLDSERVYSEELLEVRRWQKKLDRLGILKCIPQGEFGKDHQIR